MASSSERGPFWAKFQNVYINREVSNNDKRGVVLFRPVHQGTLDEPDEHTVFEVSWMVDETKEYDYVNAERMNWQQLKPHIQPRFANWHASDTQWQTWHKNAQAAAAALKAQTREAGKALESLTGDRPTVAASTGKARSAGKSNSTAGADAACPGSKAPAAAKPKAAAAKQPAGQSLLGKARGSAAAAVAKKPAAVAAAGKKPTAAAPAKPSKKQAAAAVTAAPAAKKARKEVAAAAADGHGMQEDTPSSSSGDATTADKESEETEEEQSDSEESGSEESGSAEDESSESESAEADGSSEEGNTEPLDRPHPQRKQPQPQAPKKKQKATTGHAAAPAAAATAEDSSSDESGSEEEEEQPQRGGSKKGKQQPAAATKRKQPKASSGAKVYKGRTGRAYPAEVALTKGDLRLGTAAYNSAAQGEFNVECIVDEVSVQLPSKHGIKIVRKVLPKWEGYELDVKGWEDAAGMKHLELYKEWAKNTKPDYFTAVTSAAASNAFLAWLNQK